MIKNALPQLMLLLIAVGAFQQSMALSNNIKNQQVIMQDINAYRVREGLPQLKLVKSISEIAEWHSREMAENRVPFGHGGFDGRMHQLAEKFDNAHGFAENVAYTYKDSRHVVTQWLESRGHRKNIEGNYNLTGIGIAYDKHHRVYVTQIFVKTEQSSRLNSFFG